MNFNKKILYTFLFLGAIIVNSDIRPEVKENSWTKAKNWVSKNKELIPVATYLAAPVVVFFATNKPLIRTAAVGSFLF